MKDKARQLIEKFQNITALKVTLDEETTVDEVTNHAKECALICVDELIKFTIEKKNESMYFEMDLKYWQGVKQEIEKL